MGTVCVYVLKQFINIVFQPGRIFGVDPRTGYEGLLAGSGKTATVICLAS